MTTPDDVTILLGAYFSGTLLTGTNLQLEKNLTVVQTKIGWTIKDSFTDTYTTITALLSSSIMELSGLWDLEILEIRDPSEQVSKQS